MIKFKKFSPIRLHNLKLLRKYFFHFILIFPIYLYAQQKDTLRLKEVSVQRKAFKLKKPSSTGEVIIDAKAIEEMSFFLGEKDIIKSLQHTVGVMQAKEGQSNLIVRGGNESMNLLYVDGIYLHNANHFGGLFTVINTDFVDQMIFNKSNFDASDGGKLSSVTKVVVKNKVEKPFLEGSLGLISSKITTGIPIKELKSNIIISGRRTYFDLLQPLYQNQIATGDNTLFGQGKQYYFYDYLMKSTTQINQKNELSLLLMNTADIYADKEGLQHKKSNKVNNLYGLHWRYFINKNFTNDIWINKSNYYLDFKGTSTTDEINFLTKYHQFTFKQLCTANYQQSKYTLGLEYNQTENLPKLIEGFFGDSSITIENQNTYHYRNISLFTDETIPINTDIKLKMGLRWNMFQLLENINNKSYKKNTLEPRISMLYHLNPSSNIRFNYQQINQMIHQAIDYSFGVPVDYYLPSISTIAPQQSNQFSISYVKEFRAMNVEIGSYFNQINNVTDFKSGVISNLLNSNEYADMVVGKLYAYGTEITVNAVYKKFKGSLNYTLSKTINRFQEINNGEIYNAAYDKPHNLNFSLMYKHSKKIELGLFFSLLSGQTFTPPKDLKIINEEPILTYSDRNSLRFPLYHRLDLSATYILKNTKTYNSKLNLTVYNAYNNKNPFYINYGINGNINDLTFKGIQPTIDYLFPIIPTITWNFTLKK